MSVANREAHGHEFLGRGWVHGDGLVELVMVGVVRTHQPLTASPRLKPRAANCPLSLIAIWWREISITS